MSDGIRSGVNWMRRGIEAEHGAHGLDQLGLGEARHADQQRVAAGQHGDQRLLDHLLLAEDDRADRGLGGARHAAAVVSAARTIMSSSFSRLSPATAMSSLLVIAAC